MDVDGNNDSEFDLNYFLTLFDKQDFNHERWLQLVVFCKSVGLQKEYACTLLNSFFQPRDPHENRNLWDNIHDLGKVTKGTLIYCGLVFEIPIIAVRLLAEI